jgi:hypothetical protein
MVRFCLKIDILADMKNNIYLLFLNENGLNIVEKIIPLKVPNPHSPTVRRRYGLQI